MLTLIVSCGDTIPSEPVGRLASRYDLVSYNGLALPTSTGRRIVSISASPGGASYSCDELYVMQQLAFSSPDVVSQVTQRRLACDVPQYNATFTDTLGGRVTTTSDAIVMTLGGGTVPSIVVHGRITGSALQLDLVESGTTLKSFDPTPRVFRAVP
ncbi:MAG: hypothetical protein H7247_15175 [Polaromonas sp.]|nr:hypothetical protein [Gemmatimonadaceae bacterium]